MLDMLAVVYRLRRGSLPVISGSIPGRALFSVVNVQADAQ